MAAFNKSEFSKSALAKAYDFQLKGRIKENVHLRKIISTLENNIEKNKKKNEKEMEKMKKTYEKSWELKKKDNEKEIETYELILWR